MAESVEGASRQFEAALLRQVLSAAGFDRTLDGADTDDRDDTPVSSDRDIFGGLVAGALADAVAHADGLGLARDFTRSLDAKSR